VIAPHGRLSHWQLGLCVLICGLSLGLVSLLFGAVSRMSSTVYSYEGSGHVVTSLANLQNEALRLQVVVDRHLQESGRYGEQVSSQRRLLQQRLHTVLPNLERVGESDDRLAGVEKALGELDSSLVAVSQSLTPVNDDLRRSVLTALAELDRKIDELYDREERSFFQAMGRELNGQRQTQTLLLGIAGVIPLITFALIVSLAHTFGNRFRFAYRRLDREMRERRKVEQFEQDRGRVLEMVMRDVPLARILEEIRDAVAHQRPAATCTIYTRDGDEFTHATGTPLPAKVEHELFGRIPEACATANPGEHGAVDGHPHAAGDPARTHVMSLAGRSYTVAAISSSPDTGQALGVVVLSRPDGDAREPSEDGKLLLRAGQLAGVALEHKLQARQLAHRALHDPLTELANRTLLQQRLEQAIAQAAPAREQFALYFIDLDGFKWVNDAKGHGTGDALLIQVAERLSGCIGPADTIARLGGDEFMLLAPLFTDQQEITDLAGRITTELAKPFLISGSQYTVTASVGISLFPLHGADPETLVRNADYAMYEAKERGKNGFVMAYQGIELKGAERVAMEGALRAALEADEFDLVFQPFFHAVSGTVAGVEALLRWDSPTLGSVPPGEFIPIAEGSGLIVAMGDWVLREACRRAASVLGREQRVAVNVSAVQFVEPGFLATVRRALTESGLPANKLELELTESVLLEDFVLAEQRLNDLRAMGVSIAIDDFGTGYSSLVYLHRLPLDTVKLDRSFLEECRHSGPHARNLIDSIVRMVQGIGLEVVAEGIESEEQLALVRKAGCDKVQGHLLAEAMPLGELERIERLLVGTT
jgi:diguanylate cyclase (GGDEF)-like protein